MIKLVNTLETVVGYDFYADVAERIVEERKRLGLTQKQLSEQSGVPLQVITAYEGVKIRMKQEILQKLANALGVTFDQLIGAEYDDPDCEECLYTLQRRGDPLDMGLYMAAKSPQEAFLKLYAWSFKAGIIWLMPRDRVVVTLRGTPIKKKDLAKFPKRTNPREDDPLEGPDAEAN